MADDAQYPSDLEHEWGIVTNGSEFGQSGWPYSDISATTEQWNEDDAFVESIQTNNILRNNNDPSGISQPQGHMELSPERDFPFYVPADTPLFASTNITQGLSQTLPAIENGMWASNSNISEQYRQYSISPHHLGTQQRSDGPWDPGHPRIPQYESGFVAFADSPISSSDQSSSEIPLKPDVASQDVRIESPPLESANATNQQQMEWEFINVTTHGPLMMKDNSARRHTFHRHPKGRHGPLDEQKAKDARVMRKKGACWPCRVSKVKCSIGKPCRNCRDRESSASLLSYQVCCRSGIADFHVLYFPSVLISHFNKEEVKSLVGRNVEEFIGRGRVVRVHCGRTFTPMEVTVHFYIHKKDTHLNRHHFTGPGKEPILRMIKRRCAPVGILGVDTDVLKKECLSCIKSMVLHPAYAKQVAAGDKSGIYRQILDIVHKYCKEEKNCLLEIAMQLHAMHYFMARILTFTEESASMVKKVSRHDLGLELPSDVISSRVLNRQLKHAMHILHQKQTRKVLQEFEIHLKKREQAGWPISFCVVLILCLCMEDIQIAANNFVFTDAEISQGLRSESYNACWQLEDKPYRQCTQLFHDMYRSHKSTNSQTTERGFNPMSQDGNDQTNWSQAAKDMVHGIRQVMIDSEEEMKVLSTVSVFDDSDQPRHHSLMDDHPARLLSKFLLSFIDLP